MQILITTLLLFLTAAALVVLQVTRPEFRFAWLIAIGGTLLAWISVLLWPAAAPLLFKFLPWQPAALFSESPTFSAGRNAWPYALSLVTLALSILLTASASDRFPNAMAWAGSLLLCALGLLAVTAANPLTLALVWAALDFAELAAMLRSVAGPTESERVVISFSTRAAGIALLIVADILSTSSHHSLDFSSVTPAAGVYLIVAAGLRLGVLPLHLPYPADSVLRRGFGTTLRLVAAASSLALLGSIPAAGLESTLTPALLVLAAVAAVYGGWMWLRAPDELAGRPYWMIGAAALAVAAALRGDSLGSVAWGSALILIGGALFLASVQQAWLNRLLLISAVSFSALPFTLTASGWQSGPGSFGAVLPFLLVAQALLLVGLIRHALRSATRPSFESLPAWTRNIYPVGIGLLLLSQILVSVWGWDGALQIGWWPGGVAAALLTLGLLWATPRFPALNPLPAHWIQRPAPAWLERVYGGLWSVFLGLGRLSRVVSHILEGDSGIMWTLLFLVLFISLMAQGRP